MKILGITLARGGSKGVKNKNIRKLCGKPLIEYTISEAQKSKLLTDYIVSTDSEDIKKVAEKCGAKVPFIRPADLATDTASSASALIHAVQFMESKEKIKYDYIVELMCTNPLKQAEDIDQSIKKIISSQAKSVIAVHELDDHHPARIKKIENDFIKDFVIAEPNEARRQDLRPKAYIRSGSIYCMERSYLMEDGMRYGGDNSRPYILDNDRAINIDNEIDFLVADFILKSNERSD